MKSSNLRRRSQVLVTSLLLLLSIFGIYFMDTQSHSAGANNPEQSEHQSSLINKPAHSQIYKIGTEANFQDAFKAANQRKKVQHTVRKSEIDEQLIIEQEKRAKQKAQEEEKVEKERQAVKEAEQVAKEKAQQEVEATSQNKASAEPSAPAKSTSTSNSASSNSTSSSTTSSNSKAQTQQAPQQKTQATPAPKAAPKPQPKPAQPAIGSNKIGINGVYKSYVNYGAASTDQLQVGIDAGQIVAGISPFNGNDGQTTYFGGHNPGIMNFIANSIYNGVVVTITDANGTPFKYKMIDKVDVDVYGEGVLQSIGRSAIDVYMYGANTESILIQFCNTSNNLMSFWYGVKI